MDCKTVTGIGLGVLLLGGGALVSKSFEASRSRKNEESLEAYIHQFLRENFRNKMKYAEERMERARSRDDLIRARTDLARANETFLIMSMIEGKRPDHDLYWNEFEDLMEEIEIERKQRGMRPLPYI